MYIEDKKITIKDDSLNDAKTERGAFKNIRRREFFRLLTKHDIQIERIISKRSLLREFYKLNHFLRYIKSNEHFFIKESMLFLEEEYGSFKQIIKLLDDENRYSLIRECGKDNVRIKIERTKLLNFLRVEDDFD